MALSIGGWVFHQNKRNPDLPRLAASQVRRISGDTFKGGTPLTMGEAAEITCYPLKQPQDHFRLSPDGNWVVEFGRRDPDQVVAILDVILKVGE